MEVIIAVIMPADLSAHRGWAYPTYLVEYIIKTESALISGPWARPAKKSIPGCNQKIYLGTA